MKTTHYCMISTSIDDETIAKEISTSLLNARLIACVQSYKVQSTYHWNGSIVQEEETVLHMKSRISLFEKIKIQIEALHSYETPEIIMTPILDANEAYLKWIDKETK